MDEMNNTVETTDVEENEEINEDFEDLPEPEYSNDHSFAKGALATAAVVGIAIAGKKLVVDKVLPKAKMKFEEFKAKKAEKLSKKSGSDHVVIDGGSSDTKSDN